MSKNKVVAILAATTALAAVVGIGLSILSPSTTQEPPELVQNEDNEAKQRAVTGETTASSFNFPQAACGDSFDAEATWYPVFIDNADVESIRSQYCADAVELTRKTTGKPTVQVASFTNQKKAQMFAEAVGGEVGDQYVTDRPVEVEDQMLQPQPIDDTVEPIPESQWEPPDGFNYAESVEGVSMGVREIKPGYGCGDYDPVCITYEIVSSERCESISAQATFLNKFGARLDSSFDIENNVPAGQQISFGFGVREGLIPVVQKIDFSELSCSQY
ncbi:MAG: hypothetical protein HC799_19520 [Limnothrix sp. RL_2_0]|nr:hypothetical protein [Limnothrix sp. RL_2_0]